MAQQDRKNTSGTYDGQSADRSRGGPDRRDQGGMPMRPDDEALARRAEAERSGEGSRDYSGESAAPTGEEGDRERAAETQEHREAREEVEREAEQGEMAADADKPGKDRPSYPPTRYDR